MKNIWGKKVFVSGAVFLGLIIGLSGYLIENHQPVEIAVSDKAIESVNCLSRVEDTESKCSEPVICMSSEEREQDSGDTSLGLVQASMTDIDTKLLESGIVDTDQEMLDALMKDVWQREDAVTDGWPAYREVKAKFDVQARQMSEGKTNEQLMEMVIGLREKFWSRGGTLSSAAYTDVYLARAIMEAAYEREPEDMTIGDELVETILAMCPINRRQQESSEFYWCDEVEKVKIVREKQFKQMTAEVEAGRMPTINDMIRATDVISLEQYINPPLALEAVQWAKDNAVQGGWESYGYILLRSGEIISDEGHIGFNIYQSQVQPIEQGFKYGRRLPSFKGPESRNAMLWGLMGGVISYDESSKS